MHSLRFICRSTKQLVLLTLIGYSVTEGSCTSNRANAQEGSGVKIDLILAPPKSSEAKKESSETSKSSEPKSPETSAAKSDATASAPNTSSQKKNPFVLSAFKIASDKSDTDKNNSAEKPTSSTSAPTGGQLTLEPPPAPTPKPKNSGAPATTKELETKSKDNSIPTKLPSGDSKSKEIKPLKIKDPSNNEDVEDAECPGGNEGVKPLPSMPDDVPLEQEEHPYDAPAAESNSNKPDRPISKQPSPNVPLQLSSDQLRLRTEINQLLRYYMQHPETIARRSPWAVMHAILPYGVEAELSAGNRRVNAIGWMSYNGLCKTQRIFQPTKSGFRTNLGPGVQGHEGQYLAVLAQSKVAPTYPLKVGTRTYTVNDLVRFEMATCREKSELTFKLIGLSYYLEQDQRWRDNQGGSWSLEKLVAEELDQPIVGAACGGTHRLMGLTFSLLQRKQAGLPIDGHWSRSEQFLNEFVAYAFSLQNPDGSFSTDWFEARANDPDVERKVQTTGHILEWLVYTLPDDQLQAPQVQKAIRFLLNTIGAEPGRDWPIGPRGHSLRALALYNQRVFGAQPGKLKQYIATLGNESKQR